MKIGILFIGTGLYIQFFKQVYDSFEKYFLPNHEKKYFLFTDSNDSFPDNVHVTKIPWKGFPGDTLYRYHYFLKIVKHAINYEIDVLYYSDVDMTVIDTVDDEILPTRDKPLIAIAHPGFFRVSNGTPERRKFSKAYINPLAMRAPYICGGIQGGFLAEYFSACEIMKDWIDIDEKNGITAQFHDESMWNKYRITNIHRFKILNPAYCFPESNTYKNLNGIKPKILALDKDHNYYRSDPENKIKGQPHMFTDTISEIRKGRGKRHKQQAKPDIILRS